MFIYHIYFYGIFRKKSRRKNKSFTIWFSSSGKFRISKEISPAFAGMTAAKFASPMAVGSSAVCPARSRCCGSPLKERLLSRSHRLCRNGRTSWISDLFKSAYALYPQNKDLTICILNAKICLLSQSCGIGKGIGLPEAGDPSQH